MKHTYLIILTAMLALMSPLLAKTRDACVGDSITFGAGIKKRAAEIVIIKLGTNDSKPHNWKFKPEFLDDTRSLIQHYAKLPTQPRIILCKLGKGHHPHALKDPKPIVDFALECHPAKP